MKPKTIGLFALALAVLIAIPKPALAQGTAFAYQGVLQDGAHPARGSYDVTFSLFDSSRGGTQEGPTLTNLNVIVTNGLFSATLDFGNSVFTGNDHWLELSVRTNAAAAFTKLTPRQPILPVPYAITASNVSGTISGNQITGPLPGGSLSGSYPNAVGLNNSFNSFSGNGTGLTSVNAATVGGLAASSFWKTNGNLGASPANGNFLGTSDNQPLELRVNGLRALRLEPNGNGAPNLIGGYSNNFVTVGVTSATIAGGGASSDTNSVTAVGGTVGGGVDNNAGNFGTVPGGFANVASGEFSFAAGLLAQAVHQGAFVWGDAQFGSFSSTANDQFLIRASGGVGIGTNSPAATFHVSSATGPAGPQLRVDQTTAGDFSRLRFLAGTNPYWDVAVGGGVGNVMNWFVSGVGNLMTLQPSGNLSISGFNTANSFSGNGLVGWQTTAGSAIQAKANTAYLITNSSAVSLTLPTSANVGDIVRVSGGASGGWQVLQAGSQSVLGNFAGASTVGMNWTPAGPGIGWWSVASSFDGIKLVAVPLNSGPIYTSTNSGSTWVATSSPSHIWNSVASSADGTKLVAVPGGGDLRNLDSGQIYVSTNSGATWTARATAGFWTCVASSADGTHLIATSEEQTYVSFDSGLTWNSYGAPAYGAAVACSANASNLVIIVTGGAGLPTGGIYTSTNAGITWSRTTAPTNGAWTCVASSADGKTLVAGEGGLDSFGYLWISHDSGTTWATAGNSPLAGWLGVTSSADGTRLAATDEESFSGRIYTSTNSGANWVGQATDVNNDDWIGIASSADGTKLVAADFHGQIWTSKPTTKTSTTTGVGGSLSGAPLTSAELQYIGNNQFMLLRHQGTVLAY
jgi:hypothetical protein